MTIFGRLWSCKLTGRRRYDSQLQLNSKLRKDPTDIDRNMERSIQFATSHIIDSGRDWICWKFVGSQTETLQQEIGEARLSELQPARRGGGGCQQLLVHISSHSHPGPQILGGQTARTAHEMRELLQGKLPGAAGTE